MLLLMFIIQGCRKDNAMRGETKKISHNFAAKSILFSLPEITFFLIIIHVVHKITMNSPPPIFIGLYGNLIRNNINEISCRP